MIHDMTDVIAGVATEIEVTRYGEPTVVNGRVVENPDEEIFTTMASVQPVNQKELSLLPEGMIAEGVVKVYSSVELMTVGRSECKRPDTFIADGVKYQIRRVDPWANNGAYYKSFATRMDR